MKKYVLLKLLGLVLLTMITLVICSFIEVAIYSYLIHPGQDQSVYDTHATHSAPYISGIVGFVVFFLVARHWTKKAYPKVFSLILLYPLVYVLVDVVIITAAGVQWADFIIVFLSANAAKFLGSFLGYKLSR